MNNKLTIALLSILTISVGFLFYQNFELQKKVGELTTSKEKVSVMHENSRDNSTAPTQSPFDKSYTDPLANQFSPELGQAAEPTTVKFEKTAHNFGKIKDGAVVKTVFKFTNTGKNPLIISNAQGSCGCTVPKWPQNPIKPGETDEIAVEFNSAGKAGENTKTVTVTANTNPSVTTLTIQSTVIPKDK